MIASKMCVHSCTSEFECYESVDECSSLHSKTHISSKVNQLFVYQLPKIMATDVRDCLCPLCCADTTESTGEVKYYDSVDECSSFE